MKSKRKVINNGSGFLTCLILVCILFVAGITIAGYDYFRTLQDRQKMVEDKVNHTLEKNLSEGMEKIEKKIIYQQLPAEEEADDTGFQDEIERVRQENRIANQKTAYEVLNRLNLQEGLAQDTLKGMQLQLDALKNDTSNADHISQLEEYLNGLKEGIQGLEETDRNNKNSLLDKLQTLEQILIEYKEWLENVEKSIQEINSSQETANQNYQKELNILENHIQEIKFELEVSITELKNLTEEYHKQNIQHFEQTDGRIFELEQEIQNQYTTLENQLNDLEQRCLVKLDQLEEQLLIKIEALETALEQVYTKSEVDTILKNLNLDALNKKIAEIDKRVNDCFQSVSDGKRRIASAITDKGINTAADATFQQMADNIKGLVTMSTNPSVLFDKSSWTAPYDCIAVMSFSVGFTGNDDYKQKATVKLSGVKSWETSWGETHDSHWHDWGLSGNVAWEAKAGQTYNLSFSTTNDGHILTWGWNSRTWIVPQSAARSKAVSNAPSFYDKKMKLDKNGDLAEGVPWKKEEKPNTEEDKNTEEKQTEEITQDEPQSEEADAGKNPDEEATEIGAAAAGENSEEKESENQPDENEQEKVDNDDREKTEINTKEKEKSETEAIKKDESETEAIKQEELEEMKG